MEWFAGKPARGRWYVQPMGIVDDDVRRVRDETDIIRVITEHTQLKKQGSQWMGLCPFHGEKIGRAHV
jgi:DNA primase